MKLIMTLVCRDEVDIIRQNIEFHLAHGVDHVLVTDHASVDGTREVLAEYARLGVMTVIDEAARAFPQADWMTRMAHLAREQHGADWILNNDADEFWYPASGSLKNEIGASHAAILKCHRFNMVYPYDAENSDSWCARLVYRVATPEPIPRMQDRYKDSLPLPYFYFNLPPKVMTQTKYLTAIHVGNHDATFSEAVDYRSAAVNIFHFPIRSVPQFFRKVTQSAQAILLDPNLPRYQSWHIRRWYHVIRERGTHTAIAEALPSNRRLRQDLRSGRLVEDRTIQNYFQGS